MFGGWGFDLCVEFSGMMMLLEMAFVNSDNV